MSNSFSNFSLLQCGHFVPAGTIESVSEVNHESAPARANNSTTLRLMAGSFSGLPQLSQRKTAIGTPQTRCREMHQSGRVSIMLERRSSPHAGSHLTFLISSSVWVRRVPADSRSDAGKGLEPRGTRGSTGEAAASLAFGDEWACAGIGVSMEINHCSVARKITGLWQRQQCGYECSVVSVCSNAPRLFTRSMMGWFASHTRLPVYSGRPLRRMPFSSTLLVASRPYFTPVMKSSAPCEGAV